MPVQKDNNARLSRNIGEDCRVDDEREMALLSVKNVNKMQKGRVFSYMSVHKSQQSLFLNGLTFEYCGVLQKRNMKDFIMSDEINVKVIIMRKRPNKVTN